MYMIYYRDSMNWCGFSKKKNYCDEYLYILGPFSYLFCCQTNKYLDYKILGEGQSSFSHIGGLILFEKQLMFQISL